MAVFFKRKERQKQEQVGLDPAGPGPAIDQVRGSTPIAPADPAFEALVREKSREFLHKARASRTSVLSSSFWSDKLMDWSMKDEEFKVKI